MKTVILSVGGSMLNPTTVDRRFLHTLSKTLLKASKKHKIIIVTGGGFLARDYMDALQGKNDTVKSLLGIECTRLNAHLLASAIGQCNQDIPENISTVKKLAKQFRIVVTGGMSGPRTTSDATTALIANALGADALINLTNVNGLYTKDPRKHRDAVFIPRISHDDFYTSYIQRLHEKPGQHFVLDRMAADICRREHITIVILTGMRNLEACLTEKRFIGTIIS